MKGKQNKQKHSEETFGTMASGVHLDTEKGIQEFRSVNQTILAITFADQKTKQKTDALVHLPGLPPSNPILFLIPGKIRAKSTLNSRHWNLVV